MNYPLSSLLKSGHVAPHRVAMRDRLLNAGPWFWPQLDDVTGREAATRFSPRGEHLQTGQVLLASVRGKRQVDFWRVGGHPSPSDVTATFEPSSLKSFEHARAALGRTIPLLWSRLPDATHVTPRWIASISLDAAHENQATSVLGGPSFGLAFFLMLASRAIGLPIPSGLVALAAVEPDGTVTDVDLEEKVIALCRAAPRLTTLVVHPNQMGKAREIALRELRPDVDVVQGGTGAEVLELVFGDKLGQVLAEAADNRERQDELLVSFRDLVLAGHAATAFWRPVYQAADVALSSWGRDLDSGRADMLRFYRGVAGRHANVQPAPELPATAWLHRHDVRRSMRLLAVAHYIQHAADYGSPDAAEVDRLVETFVLQGSMADDADLRVAGAYARLLAVIPGRQSEALQQARQVATEFVDRGLYAEVSMSLCIWYRLSGGLQSNAALDAADRLRDRVEARTPWTDMDRQYLALARGVALVGCGRQAEARQCLESVCAMRSGPPDIAWSGARWLARCLRELDLPTDAALVPLDQCIAKENSAEARLFAGLAALDAAVEAGDMSAALAGLAQAREQMPAPIDRLTAGELSWATLRRVSTFFPY
jgi:hypothetical protein